jgi:competence protein ComEA
MQISKFIKDYLSFGKRDRIGVLALIFLIAIIYLFPYLFARPGKPFPLTEDSVLAKAIDTLQSRHKETSYKKPEQGDDLQFESSQTKSYSNGALFRFDPNTLTVEGWQRLGLSEKTSRTIEKYRSKGGKFYQAEDIKKIWGMPEGFYERVKDYVFIEARQNSYDQSESHPFPKKERTMALVNINEADTTAYIALPGIGSKLAARIVSFRDKLGGFYSVEQVAETYGLTDSTFQKIKAYLKVDGEVKKLNINTATKDELKNHPYIRWNLANAIVEYRNQHASFKSLEELKNISLIDEASFNKLSHYLSL